MATHGLPLGIPGYQVAAGADHQQAVVDLAWPDGLPAGGLPVAAIFGDRCERTMMKANFEGFFVVTTVEFLQDHVRDLCFNDD